jgi:hypothetical protein
MRDMTQTTDTTHITALFFCRDGRKCSDRLEILVIFIRENTLLHMLRRLEISVEYKNNSKELITNNYDSKTHSIDSLNKEGSYLSLRFRK